MTTHTARVSDDEPVALAKRAMTLLQARIAEEFDLDLPMGAELEFGVLPHDQHAAGEARYYGVRGSEGKIGNHVASAYRPAKLIDPWFPESRRVGYSYREESHDTAWDKLEVVLTHRPMGADGTPVPQSALDLARHIEALRYQLHEPAPGYKPRAHGKSPAQVATREWQEFRHQKLAALSTQAQVPNTLNTNGLHLNISFIDRTTGLNIMEEMETPADHFEHALQHGVGGMMADNLHLICRDQSAIARLHHRIAHVDNVPAHIRRKKGCVYLENAICPADANPYYAMMLQLAGVYDALQRSGFAHNPTTQRYRITNPDMQVPPQQPKDRPREPFREETHRSMKQRHEQSDKLRDVLNRMEPELGDRFVDAIQRHPPGTEQTQMDKRHASLAARQ